MAEVSRILNIPATTFKRRAIKLNCYFPHRKKIPDKQIIHACNNSLSMAHAARSLNINYKTLRKWAKRLGCYKSNQRGKGISRDRVKGRIPLNEILEGKHPQYHTYELKNRLVKEGIKKLQCEKCGIVDWNGEPLAFDMHHVNGNRKDHKLENLRILCPNCHAQTDTYRGKNKRKRKRRVLDLQK